jgi:phage terminase small subunit
MLTDKQERFCHEYLIDLNATQAAIRAGYSKKTAQEIGAQNLSKLIIADYISELQAERAGRTLVTADMVIAELAKIGFHNVQDFVNGGNNVLELKHIESHKTAAVSSVKTKLKEDGSVETEIRFHDKVAALEKLGRHLGIFDKDNAQRKPDPLTALSITIVPPPDEDEG